MAESSLNKVATFTGNIWKIITGLVGVITIVAYAVIEYEQIKQNKDEIEILNDRVTKQYGRHSENIEQLELKIEQLEKEIELHLIDAAYQKGKYQSE